MNCKDYNIELCPGCAYNDGRISLFLANYPFKCFIDTYVDDIEISGAKYLIRLALTSNFNKKYLQQVRAAIQTAAPQHLEELDKLVTLL